MIHSQEGDLVVGSLRHTLRREELGALEEREEKDIRRATWLKCTVQICADKSGMSCDPGHWHHLSKTQENPKVYHTVYTPP